MCKDTIRFEHDEDPRNGEYYCYDIDTFDYLINDSDWVMTNNAIDEQDWILDQLDKMLESNNGYLIFIPTFGVSEKIDMYHELKMQDEV